ncbi:calmodulin-like protein 5 [Lingula anatina]|uniref:Calmodulin-like protein 5 n=1 Tax=Lingula anatina TaxID=7574 RepID=A0A1S3HL16_LINAN|nr:calmodulin-like protein 5 [Lingula anatina]|eukprot:XP_013386798.1 calmodulin-like protein 5 [Lingula anatina]
MNSLVVLLVAALAVSVKCNSEVSFAIDLFDRGDQDKDGELTEKELENVFLAFDTNGNGQITKQEFEDVWVKKLNLGPKIMADELFNKADIIDNDYLDHEDLKLVFKAFDFDGDKSVSLNEFLTKWGSLTLIG